jgi:hypothetical protein
MKLTEVIAHYGALRKAMGERFDSAASVLHTFCRQLAPDIDITDIHADRVAAFLAGTGPVTRYGHRKHGVLRGLYTYAISRGIVAASPLPSMVPKLPPRFVPHVYTHDANSVASCAPPRLTGSTLANWSPTHCARCYCCSMGLASA